MNWLELYVDTKFSVFKSMQPNPLYVPKYNLSFEDNNRQFTHVLCMALIFRLLMMSPLYDGIHLIWLVCISSL